jgi:hypothetical protein
MEGPIPLNRPYSADVLLGIPGSDCTGTCTFMVPESELRNQLEHSVHRIGTGHEGAPAARCQPGLFVDLAGPLNSVSAFDCAEGDFALQSPTPRSRVNEQRIQPRRHATEWGFLEPARAGEFAPYQLSDIVATELDPTSAAAIATHPRAERRSTKDETPGGPSSTSRSYLSCSGRPSPIEPPKSSGRGYRVEFYGDPVGPAPPRRAIAQTP